MNVIKDKMFHEYILDLVEQTIEYVRTQIKEHTYLGTEARFITEPKYKTVAFMVHAAIKNKKYLVDAASAGLMHQEQPKSAEVVRLEGQQLAIYEYVLTNRSITTAIACELLGVKERRARSVLSDMCKMGYLKKQGATSNLKYILNKE